MTNLHPRRRFNVNLLRLVKIWESFALSTYFIQNDNVRLFRYVCLKERNMLLTMFKAYASKARSFPNPERIDRVNEVEIFLTKIITNF